MNRPDRDSLSHPASFKDPSGFVFLRGGVVYRQINVSYREHYDHLITSGLFDDLVGRGWLIGHKTAGVKPADKERAYKVIRPDSIPFISYSYEWSFSQLQDAALLTLAVLKRALDFGMILKDAQSSNVQFVAGRPVLIDSLSFEKHRAGTPWIAYRQFCEQFLGPLAIEAFQTQGFPGILRSSVEGLRLEHVSQLLPLRTWLKPSMLIHLHLHAKTQVALAEKPIPATARGMSGAGLRGLCDSLERAVRGPVWRVPARGWTRYYEECTYSREEVQRKKEFVEHALSSVKPATVWDVGSNTGMFSKIAAARKVPVMAMDSDPAAVEELYRSCRKDGEQNILPLVMDVADPSPRLGWDLEERRSLHDRGPADMILALALIHHLAISRNVPLERIARAFCGLGRNLVVEFVPKNDQRVQFLLRSREDVFSDYHERAFENAFRRHFTIKRSALLEPSGRRLYLMSRKRG